MIRIGGAMFDPEQIACIRPGFWKSQAKGTGVYGVVVTLKNGTVVPVENKDEGSACFDTGKACKDWEEAVEELSRSGDGAVMRHFQMSMTRVEDRQADMMKKIEKISRVQTAQGKKLTAMEKDIHGLQAG